MEIERDLILAVGDDPSFLEAVSKIITDEYTLITAASEQEGLASAREHRPHLIILGFLREEGAAFRLHQRLKSGWITKLIPQIIVDIEDQEHPDGCWSQEEAMQMEAEDYICLKPREGKTLASVMDDQGLLTSLVTRLSSKANLLKRAIIDPDSFCVTWEQIPGRGAFEIQQETVFDNVMLAAKGRKIHGIAVTDNPGGNPALSTEMLCAEIKKSHMEPLVHLACRDKNRNSIESMLYGIAAEGVRNILLLSGDYPSNEGFEGMPKPVFDFDPINAVRLVQLMNNGLEHKVINKTVTLAKTDFFAGVCVSPFKQQEAELIPQYTKLEKKIRSGAHFLIPQVGYDVRKMHEILQWMDYRELRIPVVANVYVLPFGAARFMNKNNVPGAVVTDKLLNEIDGERQADDKGKSARLLRAAKQYAVAKGMGCSGAHIGGHNISYQMVEEIIDRGEELSNNWKDLVAEFDFPQDNGFYFFEKDEHTGLNSNIPAKRPSKVRVPMKYRMARMAHSLLFNEKSGLFKMLQPVAARIDRNPKRKARFGRLEHMAKVVMFDCMNCGDCALFDVAYICPMSQCPKQQRNGACGGSYQGWCEVYPDEQLCIWVQAYNRLKAFKEDESLAEYVVPPCNWELRETPSWLNFYLGRDHTAKRLGITPPKKKSASSEE